MRRHPETETIIYMVVMLGLCLALIFGGGWLVQRFGVDYEQPAAPEPIRLIATPWPTLGPEPMFQPIPSDNETPWVIMGYCVPYEYLSNVGCKEYCTTPQGVCDIFQGHVKRLNKNAR